MTLSVENTKWLPFLNINMEMQIFSLTRNLMNQNQLEDCGKCKWHFLILWNVLQAIGLIDRYNMRFHDVALIKSSNLHVSPRMNRFAGKFSVVSPSLLNIIGLSHQLWPKIVIHGNSYSILFYLTGMDGLGKIRLKIMLFEVLSWQSVALVFMSLTMDYYCFYFARNVEIWGDISHPRPNCSWRRRDMETLSPLTTISVGDPLVSSVLQIKAGSLHPTYCDFSRLP